MIEILDKTACCGCNACVQRCPKQCIKMVTDEEGFSYPQVDMDDCIDCGLCEKVCPVLHPYETNKPSQVFAAVNKDERVRQQSSSGGMFTALAEAVIQLGGVVFGARFDDTWSVVHGYTEIKEGLAAFRGSKYVQSDISDNYKLAEDFLKQGRLVLFSASPCQIAGLKHFLRKEYDNLLAVDFICHGVPSPGVWKRYLKETIARQCEKNTVSPDFKPLLSEGNALVEGISFRDKRLSWKKYSFALHLSTTERSGEKIQFSLYESFSKNPYLKGFLNNMYLRPICHSCPAKSQRSHADITLADFWCVYRYHPEITDYRGGVSLVMTNEKGQQFISQHCRGVEVYPSTYEIALTVNPAIVHNAPCHPKRADFFAGYGQAKDLTAFINQLQRLTLTQRVMKLGKRVYGRIKYELSKL